MKICSKCKVEKSLDDFSIRKDSPDGRRGACKLCRNAYHVEYSKGWYERNPTKTSEYSKRYRKNHLEECRRKDREYAKKNRAKKSAAFKTWRKKNPEKYKATVERNLANHKIAEKRWRQEHPEITSVYAANRRHLEQQATPPWVLNDPEHLAKIKEIYKSAKTLSDFHEEPYHVDHISPLKGVNENGEHVSCGLHVWYNLRPLPARENLSKGNKIILQLH